MPPPDYSYIIQPEFKLSKEASEMKLQELHNAEEFKIGAAGTHTYDKETKAQIEERYWLKSVILNSDMLLDFNDELVTSKFSKGIAEKVLNEIANLKDYTKIEIILMQQWNAGQVKSIKKKLFFTIPELEETNW